MANRKYTYKEVVDYVHNLDGKILDAYADDYRITVSQKFTVCCKNNHSWKAKFSHLKDGHWCRKCMAQINGKKKRHSVDYISLFAKKNGGKLLSNKYKNKDTLLEWECHNGHIWNAPFGSIRSGSWCPHCNTKISESIARKYFEWFFNDTFQKIRPEFLKGKYGVPLELDGFNKKLMIGFEYQGIQHYKRIPYFNKTKSFDEIKENDCLKKELCKKEKITLYEIPYYITLPDMGEYIYSLIKINKSIVNHKIPFYDYFDIYSKEIDIAKSLAIEKKGKCMSDKYIKNDIPLIWMCDKGHQWNASLSRIKRGSWCPKCKKRKKSSIKCKYEMMDVEKHAKLINIQCTSTEYKNVKTKMEWSCKENHTWSASFEQVLKMKQCPVCRGGTIYGKLSIKEAKEIAKERNGICLSEDYENNMKPLSWMCDKGHKWNSPLSSIKLGSWCKKCSDKNKGKNKRLTFEQIKNIGMNSSYKLMSSYVEYETVATKLKWVCMNDHTFYASVSQIKYEKKKCSYCKKAKNKGLLWQKKQFKT